MITKQRILIISDDPQLLGLLTDNLPDDSYRLRSTEDRGEELRAVLDDETPDLVIVDILMPWMDGIELCLRIRQWCPTPIIMLSTWGAKQNAVRGLDLSAESYLTESFDVDALMERIDGALCRN